MLLKILQALGICLFCPVAESEAQLPKVQTPLEMQATILNAFFSTVDAAFIQRYSRAEKTTYVCRWDQDGYDPRFIVTCDTDGYVTSFEVAQAKAGNFDIDCMPNTLEKVDIRECMQNRAVDTRTLPLHARSINLSINEYHGIPCLQTLPPQLVYLYLSFNALSGPIALIGLPATIAWIELHNNFINQRVVYYGDLPPHVRAIRLEKNRIQRIKSIYKKSPNNRTLDIFGQMKQIVH